MAQYGQQQQAPMQMQPVPVMTQQPIRPNTTRPGFAHHSQNRLGILQLLCGMLVCVIAVVMIFLESALYFMGYGIWTGIFFILSGALAVSSAKSKNTCPIVGCLVMSVISMMAAIVLVAFGSVGVIIDSSRCNNGIGYDQYDHDMCSDEQENMIKIGMILNGVNLLTGLFEFIVALVQMIICSRALCCAPSQPGTIYYATASQQVQAQFSPQQPQQQAGVYPQQQYAAQYPQQYGQPYGQYPPGAYQPPAQYPEHQAAGYQPQPGAPPLYPQLPQQYDGAGRPPPYNPGMGGPSAPAPPYAEAPALPAKH